MRTVFDEECFVMQPGTKQVGVRGIGMRPSGWRRCVVGCAVGLSVLLLAGVLPGAAGRVGAVRSVGVGEGWNAELLPALGVAPGVGAVVCAA